MITALILGDRKWGIWKENQHRTFWQGVTGYLERFVPGVVAQALCQKIGDVADDLNSLKRHCELKTYQNSEPIMMPYFPLDTDPTWRLGIDFAIDVYFGIGNVRWGGCGGFQFSAGDIAKYMVKTVNGLNEIYTALIARVGPPSIKTLASEHRARI